MADDGLIDSSVLIAYLRGHGDAATFLAAHVRRTHLYVAAELFAGARDKRETATLEAFVSTFDVVAPTEADTR